ncbi:hypothetical protein EJ02DRAFT_449997 [Clathrospora elynae]|uniref:Uncharacterized protein n=1 Tax=Clathrospora elynae TaxID=706981 RepID=A0A6A5T5M7_9PLEO|nr:hypothetical protein EJ02DRAFT_449997 [Clathrospora elynae]
MALTGNASLQSGFQVLLSIFIHRSQGRGGVSRRNYFEQRSLMRWMSYLLRELLSVRYHGETKVFDMDRTWTRWSCWKSYCLPHFHSVMTKFVPEYKNSRQDIASRIPSIFHAISLSLSFSLLLLPVLFRTNVPTSKP